MSRKQILIWAVVALVLFFLISSPTQAAGLVDHVINDLKAVAESILTFIKTLFS